MFITNIMSNILANTQLYNEIKDNKDSRLYCIALIAIIFNLEPIDAITVTNKILQNL